ncbi:sigma-54 dependent transcriptional regulator [Alphaproteobacteria bacterium]|nr:sigma-54 dependent transcriptional regulator [Alphaproteobacteria bacterium]
MKKILVIDDDKSIRLVLSTALTRSGFLVKTSATTAGLWGLLNAEKFDVMITDVGLPDGDTLDVLPKIQSLNPEMKIIVISAKSTLITAVRAEKKGAFYYFPKPFDLDELIGLVNKVFETSEIMSENKVVESKNLSTDKPSLYDSGPIIGKSKVMQDTYKIIARLIKSNITVLINGEIGTGKKLLAKSIHDLTFLGKKKFVKLDIKNFRIINEELSNYLNNKNHNSLYINDLKNLDGGTIFIDQVCEGSLSEQHDLLNFIENFNLYSHKEQVQESIQTRIIVTSKKDLIKLVEKGNFREDLFYKLNVMPIYLPPLRKRLEDIPNLINYFISSFNNKNTSNFSIDSGALEFLKSYHWPGNIQELKNLIERLSLSISNDKITVLDVKEQLNNSHEINDNDHNVTLENLIDKRINKVMSSINDSSLQMNVYDDFIKTVEKPLIENILNYTRGNQIKASSILGLNRNTLRKKISELGVTVRKVRKNSL